ncbi:MAG TPA: ATP-binding cassette domain-containing protein [Actinomycetota bacterium]|nr:ATP-binding cassette domain-containing protein [Actinomycetota bacterium]
MPEPAIEAEGLTKRFGDVAALDGIDLQVEEATVFGMLGPNGAGKTTAVRILATILRPDAGRAEVLGRDVVRDPEGVRRRIGLAGQYAAVDPNLTGRENLRMVGVLGQMPRASIAPRASSLLERFSLTDAADRPLRTYSGGMRRRLDIAASLMPTPPVLFLDEPTTGLDLTSRNELWAMIRELVDEGTTVLLTTQYLEEADQLAGRVAVIDGGQVIANDEPSRLKAEMGDTVVEMSFADESVAERAVGLLADGGLGKVEREHRTVRVSSNRGAHVLVDVLRRFDADGVEPATLAVREPSLDDVFLALTGHRAEAADPDEPAEGGAA